MASFVSGLRCPTARKRKIPCLKSPESGEPDQADCTKCGFGASRKICARFSSFSIKGTPHPTTIGSYSSNSSHLVFLATASLGAIAMIALLREWNRHTSNNTNTIFCHRFWNTQLLLWQHENLQRRVRQFVSVGWVENDSSSHPSAAPTKKNYVRRPTDDDGLRSLGMLNRGLIWNDDLPIWGKIRGCFQRALDRNALSCTVTNAKQECLALLNEQISPHSIAQCDVAMNLLDLSRKVTFRATLCVFFGIQSGNFEAAGINEEAFIDAIVSYFKA
eukprot:scaffold4223_cov189-Amphora_coffeaeformis.AAC.8